MNALHKCCSVHGVAYILVLVGALNWGLVALSGYVDMNLNVVNLLLGSWPMVEQAVYLLVGLSAIAMLFQSSCKACMK
ncbi:DUF378 domain-containing protein [Candidatus Gracilibacteria bacterium]|nr:DUF378 domain-containing protein [Candidatus Gracilibacteria bacterium]